MCQVLFSQILRRAPLRLHPWRKVPNVTNAICWTCKNCSYTFWGSPKDKFYTYSKSALVDHANQANHTIDWKKTTVIDRE